MRLFLILWLGLTIVRHYIEKLFWFYLPRIKKVCRGTILFLSLKTLDPINPKPRKMFDKKIVTNWDLSVESRLEYIKLIMKDKGFTHLGNGRHRATFLSPNKKFVIKFPHNKYGLEANKKEASLWKKYLGKPDEKGVCYLPCRLIMDTVILMEAVTESYGGTVGCDTARESGAVTGKDLYVKDGEGLPAWYIHVDCCQIGLRRNGKIGVYDYG